MSTISVIVDQREPEQVQLYATGIDGSFAAITGATTSTWWLAVGEARRLFEQLGATLHPRVEGGGES